MILELTMHARAHLDLLSLTLTVLVRGYASAVEAARRRTAATAATAAKTRLIFTLLIARDVVTTNTTDGQLSSAGRIGSSGH